MAITHANPTSQANNPAKDVSHDAWNAPHVGGAVDYIQSTDPGAVGAGVFWLQTSVNAEVGSQMLWVRNLANTAWTHCGPDFVIVPVTGDWEINGPAAADLLVFKAAGGVVIGGATAGGSVWLDSGGLHFGASSGNPAVLGHRTFNPAFTGQVSPLASVLLRQKTSTTGEAYLKTGTADTAWTPISTGQVLSGAGAPTAPVLATFTLNRGSVPSSGTFGLDFGAGGFLTGIAYNASASAIAALMQAVSADFQDGIVRAKPGDGAKTIVSDASFVIEWQHHPNISSVAVTNNTTGVSITITGASFGTTGTPSFPPSAAHYLRTGTGQIYFFDGIPTATDTGTWRALT